MQDLTWTGFRPGATRPAPDHSAPRESALRLPDLDAPAVPAVPRPAGPSREELDAMLDAAREAGIAEGRADGERAGFEAANASRAAALDGALAAATSRLEQAVADAAALAEANARALAALLLGALDAALPGAASRFAPEMLDHLVTQLGPVADAPAGATVLVPPALLEEAGARLAASGLPVEADPALPAGDARIAWRGGSLALDLAERRRAVRAVLCSLGLTPEQENPA